jgi:hypothetical protein
LKPINYHYVLILISENTVTRKGAAPLTECAKGEQIAMVRFIISEVMKAA